MKYYYLSLLFALFFSGFAAAQEEGSRIREVMRRPMKEYASLACYIVAIAVAFIQPYVSVAIYVAVAAVWIIPDRRFARP